MAPGSSMSKSIRIVRNRDLEAFWGVLRAKEPGYMRSLLTWMGGPEGCINTRLCTHRTTEKT